MRSLVLYYSLTGNTKFFAEKIAAYIGASATLEEIVTYRDMERYGKLKLFIAAAQQLFNLQPSIMPLEHIPADFDRIFIGTPIWMGRHVPAINTFLTQYPLQGKKIVLFSCCGEKNTTSRVGRLKEQLGAKNTIESELKLKDPEKTTLMSGEKIEAWLQTLAT